MPTKKAKTHLFLCHSHDDKPFVRKLAGHLSELGVDVWLDEWELAPGDSLHDCIGAALASASYVGVVLSPDSVASRWCKSELQQALAREKRTGETVILPLLYRRVTPPPFLEDRLYANFTRSYFTALTELAAFVHGVHQPTVARELADRKPRSVAETVEILEAGGWKGVKYMSERDYVALRRLLSRAGIKLQSDEFDIVPRARARSSKKTSRSRRYHVKK
jgi:hypothetical protein